MGPPVLAGGKVKVILSVPSRKFPRSLGHARETHGIVNCDHLWE